MNGVLEAIVGLCVLVALVAYAVGTNQASSELAEECNANQETVIDSTVYECRPLAHIVDGKRFKLEELHD